MTSAAKTPGTERRINPKGARYLQRLGTQWQLLLMSVPMLLYVILFNYVPLFGWVNAFKDISNERGTLISFLRGENPADYGFNNFTNLFKPGAIPFMGAIRNTLAMSLINLVMGTVSAVVLAVLLNEVRQKTYKRTVQTVTYLPHFLSWTIVVSLTFFLLSSEQGLVNKIIIAAGGEKRSFLFDKSIIYFINNAISAYCKTGLFQRKDFISILILYI